MASEEILSEAFRYFKEYKQCNIEFSDSWKTKIGGAIDMRCKELDITEDEVIYQLIEDEVMYEFSSEIQAECFHRLAKFHGIDWRPSTHMSDVQ